MLPVIEPQKCLMCEFEPNVIPPVNARFKLCSSKCLKKLWDDMQIFEETSKQKIPFELEITRLCKKPEEPTEVEKKMTEFFKS